MPDNRVKQYGYLYGLFAVTYVIYLVLFEINGAEDVKEGIAYLFTGLILYAIYTYSFIIITAVYVYNYFVPCKITDRTNE